MKTFFKLFLIIGLTVLCCKSDSDLEKINGICVKIKEAKELRIGYIKSIKINRNIQYLWEIRDDTNDILSHAIYILGFDEISRREREKMFSALIIFKKTIRDNLLSKKKSYPFVCSYFCDFLNKVIEMIANVINADYHKRNCTKSKLIHIDNFIKKDLKKILRNLKFQSRHGSFLDMFKRKDNDILKSFMSDINSLCNQEPIESCNYKNFYELSYKFCMLLSECKGIAISKGNTIYIPAKTYPFLNYFKGPLWDRLVSHFIFFCQISELENQLEIETVHQEFLKTEFNPDDKRLFDKVKTIKISNTSYIYHY